MSNQIEFVFVIKWFESKRHKISSTEQYFLNPEHIKSVFDDFEYKHGLARVEYVPVSIDSVEYRMAFKNSKIETDREKENTKNEEEEDDGEEKPIVVPPDETVDLYSSCQNCNRGIGVHSVIESYRCKLITAEEAREAFCQLK